jgi:hypothetical protein
MAKKQGVVGRKKSVKVTASNTTTPRKKSGVVVKKPPQKKVVKRLKPPKTIPKDRRFEGRPDWIDG